MSDPLEQKALDATLNEISADMALTLRKTIEQVFAMGVRRGRESWNRAMETNIERGLAAVGRLMQDVKDHKLKIEIFGDADDGTSAYFAAVTTAWMQGLRNQIPKVLLPYVAREQQETDPEWETYQRLKRKFDPTGEKG